MNSTQSSRFIADLLETIMRSVLYLKNDNTNLKFELTVARKVEITLSYHHLPDGAIETSDLRRLKIIGTNVRGYLDILIKDTSKEYKQGPAFPDLESAFNFIDSRNLPKFLETFFEGNPCSDEIEKTIYVYEIPLTKIVEFSNGVVEQERRSRIK